MKFELEKRIFWKIVGIGGFFIYLILGFIGLILNNIFWSCLILVPLWLFIFVQIKKIKNTKED